MSQEISTIKDQKKSLISAMATKYAMDPMTFQNVIRSTVMPSSATNEQMAAFLLVANQYDLNPITKEIYAFPAKGGGIQPVVGIDGWINLAQRRAEFDGMDYEFEHDAATGRVTSCTCSIYRKDRSRPVRVTEYMEECFRGTEPWKTHPRRMLRHKATIQAIRYAFGFAGIKDEDDAETMAVNVVSTVKQTEDRAKPIQIDHDRGTLDAPTLPALDAEAFAAKLPGWRQAFEKGKAVADLLSAISTRFALSDEQREEIESWGE